MVETVGLTRARPCDGSICPRLGRPGPRASYGTGKEARPTPGRAGDGACDRREAPIDGSRQSKPSRTIATVWRRPSYSRTSTVPGLSCRRGGRSCRARLSKNLRPRGGPRRWRGERSEPVRLRVRDHHACSEGPAVGSCRASGRGPPYNRVRAPAVLASTRYRQPALLHFEKIGLLLRRDAGHMGQPAGLVSQR